MVYIHGCTCRQGRPVGTSVGSGSAEITGIFAIHGGVLGSFWRFLEGFVTISPDPH